MKTIIQLILPISFAVLFCHCTSPTLHIKKYDSFSKEITIPPVSVENAKKFNPLVKAEFKTIIKNGKEFSGYVSNNKKFLEEVITPILKPHLQNLKTKHPVEIINILALFGHEIFRKYFGKDFYRWGGDILDLDDPQDESIRYEFAYGLDCSGFTTLPYELAVYFKLFSPEATSALFSSKGFEFFCKQNNVEDKGGREGTSNNFRVDTKDLYTLGNEIIRIEKNQTPTSEQLALLQAGDIVGRDGHFGIIVEIEDELFFLESGGWVVPNNDGFPCSIKESIEIFAKRGTVSVRRCLPKILRKN